MEVRLNVDSRRSRWPSDFQKVIQTRLFGPREAAARIAWCATAAPSPSARAQIGLVCDITPRVAPRGSSGAGATTDSRELGFPGLRSRQIESDAPRRIAVTPLYC